MKKRITIKEIAEIAGVSVATVSRVINNYPYVDKETKQKVLKVIKKYNFVPNPAAKTLPAGRTEKYPYKKSIGIVISDTAKYGFANLFFSKVFYGIMEEVMNYKFNIFTKIISSSLESMEEEVNFLVNICDGVIGIGYGIEKFIAELLKKVSDFPVVLIESYSRVPSLKINSVLVDNFNAGYMATKYLIECGHRKIGIIKGPDDYITALDRYKGFLFALSEAGLKIKNEYIETGNLEYAGGYEAIVKMINKIKRKDFPTAIFCVNDFTALGAKDALEKNGFIIPDKVSLIGFDNIELTEQVVPPLTTVNVDKESLGRLAVKRLYDLINNQEFSIATITISVSLVERASVKKQKLKIIKRGI